ncbi:MAG: hypothetical protein JNM27_11910 [Leptospirales bacterium]|nr:hypothetical protein [Leptospirales bacterium]
MRWLAIVSLSLLFSCAGASAGIALSNVPLESQTYTVLGPAETTKSWWGFDLGVIAFPLGEPPVSEAMQDVIKQKEGDALVNLRYSTDRTIIFFMTRHRFHLKADVIKLEKK